MAWGKSEAEKQQERLAKEQELRDAQKAMQAQQAALAAAAFARSPVGRATEAFAAQAAFFQIELTVSELSGEASFFGSSGSTVTHSGGATDVLGRIEAVGWHLEHVGYVFIETGATSTNQLFSTGQGTVTQGNVTGIYLFRRVG